MRRATVLALALVACAANGKAGDVRDAGSPKGNEGARVTATLTLEAAVAELGLSPLPAGGAASLRLEATRVENPSLQGVSLRVTLRSKTRGDGDALLGTVSLYPSDRPGIFLLALSPQAKALAREGGLLRIELRSPLAGGVLRAPLTIGIGEPAWR